MCENHLNRQPGPLTFCWVIALVLTGLMTGSVALTATMDEQRFSVYLPHPSGIAIRNARSGAVCLEDDEPVRVCRPVYSVEITGDATCQWSEDVQYPCTWYGYEFDLENVDRDLKIVCDVTNSILTIFGPETEEVTGSNSARYTEQLTAGQTHLFHPAYHTYAPVSEETAVVSVHACSVDGVPLFQASFRAYYEPE
jgi:hypothetical protein